MFKASYIKQTGYIIVTLNMVYNFSFNILLFNSLVLSYYGSVFFFSDVVQFKHIHMNKANSVAPPSLLWD